jgi:hypothetical protein
MAHSIIMKNPLIVCLAFACPYVYTRLMRSASFVCIRTNSVGAFTRHHPKLITLYWYLSSHCYPLIDRAWHGMGFVCTSASSLEILPGPKFITNYLSLIVCLV